MIALFCSVIFRTTSMSLMTTYLIIILLFCAPLAINFFAVTFFETHPNTPRIAWLGVASPFSAAFGIPLDISLGTDTLSPEQLAGNWPLYALYVLFTLALNGVLLLVMMWQFATRWRVASA